MFWIHGSESFLWTILFRVTVQRFTIYNPRTLLRASILNSGYYIWFTCRQMEKHSEIRIGTYNEGSRKVKLTYLWVKRGKSNNDFAFQILMWSECLIHSMLVIRHSISISTVQVLRFINQIPILVLRSDPGDQASIKDTLWKKEKQEKDMKMLTTSYGFERKNAPNETRQIELELELESDSDSENMLSGSFTEDECLYSSVCSRNY